MKNIIFLSVPPVIIDEKTSTDLVVREASNVTLVCKASGYPEPYVMWRREDGDDFSYNGENGMYSYLNIILFQSRIYLIFHDVFQSIKSEIKLINFRNNK